VALIFGNGSAWADQEMVYEQSSMEDEAIAHIPFYPFIVG